MPFLKKSLSLFVLLTHFCFGQKAFKIKECQLAFVNLEKGIIVKKGDSFYEIKLNKIDNYSRFVEDVKYELQSVTQEELDAIKKDSSTISASNITSYDFKNLETKKFTTSNTDNNYQFYKYNKNFFTIDFLKDSIRKPTKVKLFHYCILDFANNKKIIYHEGGFIVPQNGKINFLFSENEFDNSFKNYKISELTSFTPAEVFSLESSKLRLNEDFYKIDSLKNKQVKIVDLYNQKVINKTFDSIVFNDYFIVGYKKGKINIYNCTFQDSKIANLKAVGINKFYPFLQIIEANAVKRISLIGGNYKPFDILYRPDFSVYFDSQKIHFKIVKEDGAFYLHTEDIFSLIPSLASFETRFKLLNAQEYDTIEFLNEDATITLNSEMTGFSIKWPIMIYAKLHNGKYNLTTFEYLATKKLNDEILKNNDKLPKNLDAIEEIGTQTYFIRKDGLCTIYPIMKEIKYKKLESFQENFARFELPNGQKGWLDLHGNEYLDD